MHLGQQFQPEIDDPVAFDAAVFKALASEYADCLSIALDDVRTKPWFSECLEGFSQQTADWSFLARHLFLGFSIADAMGLSPSRFRRLWEGYVRTMVFPFSTFDHSLDMDTVFVKSPSQVVATYVVAALLKGEEFFSANEDSRSFWEVMRPRMLQLAEVVHFELSIRYDEKFINDPVPLLNMFKTSISPFFRSNSCETLICGFARISGLRIDSKNTRLFDDTRQLLDDLADLRQDLGVGRLTYPSLLALNDKAVGSELKALIRRLWASQSTIGYLWPQIRYCFLRSETLPILCAEVQQNLDLLQDWVRNNLPGKHGPLLA